MIARIVGTLLVLAAIGFGVLSIGQADASGCRVVTVRAAASYHAPYVAPAAVAYYQPVAAYSVGYQPDLTEAIKLLIEDNRSAREENRLMQERLIQALTTGGGGPMPLKAGPPHPGSRVMATRCATCHDETTAKAKGGGNVLFRGGVFIDDGDNLDRAVQEIDSGRMPKGGKLTDKEAFDALRFLVLKPAPEKLEAPAKLK